MSNQKTKSAAKRHSAFSVGLIAIAVAATILFNLLAAQLPDSIKQFDMTDSGIYDITDTTLAITGAMTEDVQIIVLNDKLNVDTRISRFLEKYAGLSDHLILEYIDPVVYPSILKQYEAESNSVVVRCEATGRQETFALDDVIGIDQMSYYYYGTRVETDFDAEGLLTAAVDGVLNTAGHKVYTLHGHSEINMWETAQELLKKSHIEVGFVNLMTDGELPDDCEMLIITAPIKDLADDELAKLREYLSAGGQIMYFMDGSETSLPNFEALCADYGMTVNPGYVMDSQSYYQNNPFLIFPKFTTATDATGVIASDQLLMMYMSRGMTLTTPVREAITVKSFLDTSEGGYLMVNNEAMNPGKYSVGAVATEAVGDKTARFVVFGSHSPQDSDLNTAFGNLDNLDFFVAAVTAGFDDVSPISIEAVSLSEPHNTITASGTLSILIVLILPALVLLVGFVHWLRRRRL